VILYIALPETKDDIDPGVPLARLPRRCPACRDDTIIGHGLRRPPLLEALESCGIEVLPVCGFNEAQQILGTQPVQVVLTDTALPDGDWRRLLEIVVRGCSKIEVVVCSRFGDPKLWLDVLDAGGYDVLVQPYECEEIKRILESAAARRHLPSPDGIARSSVEQ
jgi:DNA-binding NtrC family response regulator